MPRVILGQWTQKDEQFVRNLKAELGRRGKGYKNLMRRTGKSQGAVYKRFNQPGTTTVDELRVSLRSIKLKSLLTTSASQLSISWSK